MKRSLIRPLLLSGAMAIAAGLSGCIATPVDPYYGGTGYGYGYGPEYGYGYPSGAGFIGSSGYGYYGGAPVVIAPPIGIGIGIGGVFGSSYGNRGYRGYSNYGGYRGYDGHRGWGGQRPGFIGGATPQPKPSMGGWGVRSNGGGGWGGRGGGGRR